MTPGRTPLYALHAALGARFTTFAGFEMPLQYAAGLRAEHLWTRAHAGFFDVSHMGQVRVTGPDLHAALERALPLDFDGWPAGVQRYALLLADDGGIVDDLMALRLEGDVRLVVNASGRTRDLARLRALCPALSFELLDDALVALQGPAAEDVLGWLAPEAARLRFMHGTRLVLDGTPCFVTRSGYTGEDGYEIAVPREGAEKVARRLLAHPDVRPAGLGARDTLRLEAGLPLHGQDIDEATGVVESGLAWTIARSRRAGGAKAGGYPGAERTMREAAQGTARRSIGFAGIGSVPVRSGAEVVLADGRVVGSVTSGTVSPTLGRPIGLARIDARAAEGAALFARVREQARPIERVSLPFVPKRYRRTG